MKKVLFACMISAAIIAPAHAAGPYVGVGVTYFNKTQAGQGKTGSLKLLGGYDFNETWGMEAGMLTIPPVDHYGPGGMYFGEEKGRHIYLAGKATMPISDKWSLLTKLGVGHTRMKFDSPTMGKFSDNKVGLYAGIGVRYALTEKVSLTLELERLGRSTGGKKTESMSLNVNRSF